MKKRKMLPVASLVNTTLNNGSGSGASVYLSSRSSNRRGRIAFIAGNGTPSPGILGRIIFNPKLNKGGGAACLTAQTTGGVNIDKGLYVSKLTKTYLEFGVTSAIESSGAIVFYYIVAP